jgi:hypothetical protein
VRPESSWRKTVGCGFQNSVPETLLREKVRPSQSSDHCSFPKPRATPQFSLTLSCGLAGEQCLETPAGASRARVGGTMTVRPNIPMELNVTGKTLRRAFALVIHDSAQERGIPSDWKPSGACSQ